MAVFIQQHSLPDYLYTQIQTEQKLIFDVRAKWESYNQTIYEILDNKDVKILNSAIDEANQSYGTIFWFKEVLVIVDISNKWISLALASNDKQAIDQTIEWLKEVFPPEPDEIDGKVKVRFWYITTSGPKHVIRTISVPDWQKIEDNYDTDTLKDLEFLIKDYKPQAGGQLIILSGVPGTGKSYYLRSLLYMWKDWCSAEYVLDPENLFGGAQGYMADLVLRNSYDDEFDYVSDEEDRNKWKLLILEDSGDLLRSDASDRVGQQGLSRLLNLVDGLIGQGLRVLVLITTNEDFDKFHPAVSRDGRCAAAIKFNPLSREKAERWMNGSSPKLPEGKERFTLAELYALTKGTTVKKLEKESAGLGFKMR